MDGDISLGNILNKFSIFEGIDETCGKILKVINPIYKNVLLLKLNTINDGESLNHLLFQLRWKLKQNK